MTVKNVIKHAARKEHISQRDFAEKLGISQGALSTTLKRDDGMGMGVRKFCQWLEALDYELIVRKPFDPDDEEFVVDGYSEGDDFDF